jgi:hypothetical protein
MKSWKKPTDETIEKALASVKKETDRQYFFSRLKNPLWIRPLAERGHFQSPPKIKILSENHVQFPFWPELQYLKNVAEYVPEEVIKLVLQLPNIDNPRVFDDILDIALKLHGKQSAMLKPKMLEYAIIEHQFFTHRYPYLLAHWTNENQAHAALELSKLLIKFFPDPKLKDKQTRRELNLNDWTTSLEPVPRIEKWEYQEILNKGVRPLAEKEPYQVALILIDATANMICLRMHQDALDRGEKEDISDFWCRRLNVTGRNEDSKETLVHMLTFACEKVYEKLPESIAALNEVLCNQRWKVFTRLRQHLYALNPNEQTKPWIRELILEHEDYNGWEYHYEFQRMIRLACEHFGEEMLIEEERTHIFDAILSGPSKTEYREWWGERFTEERFKQRTRRFHHKQFRPFFSILFGKYDTYFRDLEADESHRQISDEDYSPVGETRSGTILSRSPKPKDELLKLLDEDLLSYINDWQDSRYLDEDNFIEINIRALAAVFQTVFQENIIPDIGRLEFWIENRKRIERPVYVHAIVKGMQEHIKTKHFDRLEVSFDFCEWVLSSPDKSHEGSDESRENPDWSSSKRAVLDFVEMCLNGDANVPILARDRLAKLLGMLCTQFDWHLDRGEPVIPDQGDPFTEAINITRSRALENLVNFGFWIRKYDGKANVPEVTSILDERFRSGTKYQLTLPEQVMLATHYGRICDLDKAWAVENKSDFFPQSKLPVWIETFGNFLRSNRPLMLTFEIVHEDFVFALDHLADFKQRNRSSRQMTDTLGEHLFTYYLWELYPLTGKVSLLERYYNKTDDYRKHWAKLFDHVGRSLKNSGKHLDEGLKTRIIDFFNWRFKAREPIELREFTFWLGAECLDAEWRLAEYSNILDIIQSKNEGITIELDALQELLTSHTAMVVECFAKLTIYLPKDKIKYIRTDKAKSILKAGLESRDENVRKKAERAREKLLREGRSEFFDT